MSGREATVNEKLIDMMEARDKEGMEVAKVAKFNMNLLSYNIR